MKDNRFIIEESDAYIPKKDMICRNCKFRARDYSDAYKFAVCDKYPGEKSDHSDMKPRGIMYKNESCNFYEKES